MWCMTRLRFLSMNGINLRVIWPPLCYIAANRYGEIVLCIKAHVVDMRPNNSHVTLFIHIDEHRQCQLFLFLTHLPLLWKRGEKHQIHSFLGPIIMLLINFRIGDGSIYVSFIEIYSVILKPPYCFILLRQLNLGIL